MNIKQIISKYKKNFIIQELIPQHPVLKEIHYNSINTIRLMSFLHNGEVHVLSSVLRMGINNSRIDNGASGGIHCGIKDDGCLNNFAFDSNGIKYDRHPQGYKFEGCIIPSYDKIIQIIKREHSKLAHLKLISWDFAIDIDGNPVLIEINLRSQSINVYQLNNGPVFGDLTETVLEEVFLKKGDLE